jgi:hypothetical protein
MPTSKVLRPTRLLLLAALLTAAAAPVSTQTLNFTPAGKIPGPVDQIDVHGKYAYLAADYVFSIMDLSDLSAPRQIGTYKFPEKIWGFRVIGSLVYVAADFYGLGILDVADPTKPVLRGFLKLPGQAKGVALVGKTALLTDHMSGVDFVDVSDASKPLSLGSFFLDGYARDVVSAGTAAYAVDSPTGLYVFDLSKPFDMSKPEPFAPASAQQTVSGARFIDVDDAAQERAAGLAVMAGGPELQVYDVSDPRSAKKLASFAIEGGTQRAMLVGDRAYVAAASGGLHVVDLSKPQAPRVIGRYPAAAPARDVAVADSLVFVVTGKVATRYQGDGEVVILRQSP